MTKHMCVIQELTDIRCECGRLMARATPAGVELKCPRCKRTVLLQWQKDAKCAGYGKGT